MKVQEDGLWLATQPVDMRTGIDGLSLHVQQALGASLRRHCLRVRQPPPYASQVVCWDGTGVWMCLRRLHRGQFVWPPGDEPRWQLSAEQWQWLVAGVDWQRLSAPAPAKWRL